MKPIVSVAVSGSLLVLAIWLFLLQFHNLRNATDWSIVDPPLRRNARNSQTATSKIPGSKFGLPPAEGNDNDAARTALEKIMSAAPRGPGGVPLPKIERLFTDFPSVKNAFVESVKANRRLSYAQFFVTAGMTDGEIEAFCNIIAEREQGWADLVTVAQRDGLSENSPEYKDIDKAATEERDRKLRELLGPERFERLLAFRETLDDGLIGLHALVTSGDPSSLPSIPTMATLGQLSADARIFNTATWQGGARPPDFERVRSEASKLLTPTQLELFNLLLDHHEIAFEEYRISLNNVKPGR